MRCELMHKDVPVADIDVGDCDGELCRLGDIYSKEHLPVGTLRNGYPDLLNLSKWWALRSIPESCSGLRRLLERARLPNAKALLTRSYGLCLSDQYWIRPAGSNVSWGDVNFFENDFSEDVGRTLLGHEIAHGEMDLMSPDNTSEGNLVKMWRIIDGRRCLYKGGSAPNRQEPINEVIASMICESMGIPNAGYGLETFGGSAYSVCDDFIDGDTELVSMAYVMYTCDWKGSAYRTCVDACGSFGVDIVPFLDRMIVLDYLIANEDRHFHNFGLIRDADSLKFLRPAPIFDCGTSLGYNLNSPDMASGAGGVCKPFASTHESEMDLVSDLEWVDIESLRSSVDRVDGFLKLAGDFITCDRSDGILAILESRIDGLESRL